MMFLVFLWLATLLAPSWALSPNFCVYRRKTYTTKDPWSLTMDQVKQATDKFCTHLVLADFVEINFNGDLIYQDGENFWNLNIGKLKTVTDGSPPVKVLVSIGGFKDPTDTKYLTYLERLHSLEISERFINSVISFLEKHDIDGVEIALGLSEKCTINFKSKPTICSTIKDFTNPRKESPLGYNFWFEELLGRLHRARLGTSKMLTLSLLPAFVNTEYYDVMKLMRHVDYVILWTVDYTTPDRTLKEDLPYTESIVDDWKKKTAPVGNRRIVLGLGTWVLTWNSVKDQPKHQGRLTDGTWEDSEDSVLSFWRTNELIIGFETPTTVKERVKLFDKYELGGIGIPVIGMKDFDGKFGDGIHPINKKVYDALQNQKRRQSENTPTSHENSKGAHSHEYSAATYEPRHTHKRLYISHASSSRHTIKYQRNGRKHTPGGNSSRPRPHHIHTSKSTPHETSSGARHKDPSKYTHGISGKPLVGLSSSHVPPRESNVASIVPSLPYFPLRPSTEEPPYVTSRHTQPLEGRTSSSVPPPQNRPSITKQVIPLTQPQSSVHKMAPSGHDAPSFEPHRRSTSREAFREPLYESSHVNTRPTRHLDGGTSSSGPSHFGKPDKQIIPPTQSQAPSGPHQKDQSQITRMNSGKPHVGLSSSHVPPRESNVAFIVPPLPYFSPRPSTEEPPYVTSRHTQPLEGRTSSSVPPPQRRPSITKQDIPLTQPQSSVHKMAPSGHDAPSFEPHRRSTSRVAFREPLYESSHVNTRPTRPLEGRTSSSDPTHHGRPIITNQVIPPTPQVAPSRPHQQYTTKSTSDETSSSSSSLHKHTRKSTPHNNSSGPRQKDPSQSTRMNSGKPLVASSVPLNAPHKSNRATKTLYGHNRPSHLIPGNPEMASSVPQGPYFKPMYFTPHRSTVEPLSISPNDNPPLTKPLEVGTSTSYGQPEIQITQATPPQPSHTKMASNVAQVVPSRSHLQYTTKSTSDETSSSSSSLHKHTRKSTPHNNSSGPRQKDPSQSTRMNSGKPLGASSVPLMRPHESNKAPKTLYGHSIPSHLIPGNPEMASSVPQETYFEPMYFTPDRSTVEPLSISPNDNPPLTKPLEVGTSTSYGKPVVQITPTPPQPSHTKMASSGHLTPHYQPRSRFTSRQNTESPLRSSHVNSRSRRLEGETSSSNPPKRDITLTVEPPTPPQVVPDEIKITVESPTPPQVVIPLSDPDVSSRKSGAPRKSRRDHTYLM